MEPLKKGCMTWRKLAAQGFLVLPLSLIEFARGNVIEKLAERGTEKKKNVPWCEVNVLFEHATFKINSQQESRVTECSGGMCDPGFDPLQRLQANAASAECFGGL